MIPLPSSKLELVGVKHWNKFTLYLCSVLSYSKSMRYEMNHIIMFPYFRPLSLRIRASFCLHPEGKDKQKCSSKGNSFRVHKGLKLGVEFLFVALVSSRGKKIRLPFIQIYSSHLLLKSNIFSFWNFSLSHCCWSPSNPFWRGKPGMIKMSLSGLGEDMIMAEISMQFP